MNTDIRISISFKSHRKRKKLKRLLGDGYLDYLIDLWIGVALDCPSGKLRGWTEGDIADEAGFEGDVHHFCLALKEAGFLDWNGEYFSCHDWEEHQSWACKADERKEKASKAANCRWDNATSNATSNAKSESSNATSNAPILSYPILTKNSKRFTPPSFDEVKDYCNERRNKVDVNKFIDFYESKGWMIGKNKMKSWKACVRTWERNDPKDKELEREKELLK